MIDIEEQQPQTGPNQESQLEVQQIDTLDSGDTFGSAAAGTGKGIDYATTPFLGSTSPCPFICPMTTNSIAQWQVSLC